MNSYSRSGLRPAETVPLDEVLRGLRSPQKELPCKLFYDEIGSRLFEQITELDEYYPTRSEMRIMRTAGAEIAAPLGPECLLIEYDARRLLARIAETCGPAGGLPVGVDLKKGPLILHRAYNDALGITASFNLNILARLNRELGANFALEQFRHYAFYNPVFARVEMYLISLIEQVVHIGHTTIHFDRGESIWTEASYKYNPQSRGNVPTRRKLARTAPTK